MKLVYKITYPNGKIYVGLIIRVRLCYLDYLNLCRYASTSWYAVLGVRIIGALLCHRPGESPAGDLSDPSRLPERS